MHPSIPRYKCHKEVGALKIKSLEKLNTGALRITPEDTNFLPFEVESRFVPQHEPARPHIGWYVVFYDNDYISFSPPDAFESGYTRIPE